MEPVYTDPAQLDRTDVEDELEQCILEYALAETTEAGDTVDLRAFVDKAPVRETEVISTVEACELLHTGVSGLVPWYTNRAAVERAVAST